MTTLGLLLALLPMALTGQPANPTVDPKPGLVIRSSTKLTPGDYLVPGESEAFPALRIDGDNITVDLRGVTLRGTPAETEPDERVGFGVVVNGKNVTVLGGTVRGYKVGLIARNSPGIRIDGGDFSYNWKQRLLSGLDAEDTADWMSFHRNEQDEWLRFGAAIYLRDCDGFVVANTTAEGGQCGLMITDTSHGLAYNNNWSFLSAVGLGLFRSSDNRFMHNKIDWCVRGYSHGVYNRGQDSTGILIYEQSHRNIFAYNSVTHGGDGFFLWAGQTSMDTGQGGCNDNLLYGNDFSHAPTNGIEATFSRNDFVNNLLLECWHGVWGGYSFDSKIIGNTFGHNGEGIAIEHGQHNSVRLNAFDRDNIAIYLWSNPNQDPNWGYPKFRDTRNVGTRIEANVFRNVSEWALDLRRGTELSVSGNVFRDNAKVLNSGELTASTFSKNTVVGPEEQPATLELRENNWSAEGFKGPLPRTMFRSGTVAQGVDPELGPYLARFQVGWNPWPGKPVTPALVASTLTEEELSRAEREILEFAPEPLEGGMDPFLPADALRGRRYILVDNWGPYDFKSPVIWPRWTGAEEVTASGRIPAGARDTTQRFEIIGPPGKWRVVELRGVTLSAQSGSVPATIEATVTGGKATDMLIELEYVGEATTDYRGVVTPAGQPVRFRYEKFVAPIDWTVKWWAWEKDKSDPRTQERAFQAIWKTEPLRSEQRDELNYAWGGSPGEGVPNDYFLTVAEGTLDITPGEYILDITTDDGVRVYVDGKRVLDQWKYQGPTNYPVTMRLGGQHKLRVEHFEIDGYSTLQLRVKRKR